MSEGNEAHLLRLATAITDGLSVEWSREAVTDGPMQERIQRLRILECIAKTCGRPQDVSAPSVARTPNSAGTRLRGARS